MAGPVPLYLDTQLAAQTTFNVPFGLLTLVNDAITTATATGKFNTTIDCSLFVAEDVSNFRVYLDSLGYFVEYAKGPDQKGLLIDWGHFLNASELPVTVLQGTSPWIVDGSGFTQPISGSVNILNFPAVQPVSGTITSLQGTSPWTIAGTVTANAGTGTFLVDGSAHTQPISGTVAATQGTSPWIISGSVTTSPNVNIHDGSGNTISSTTGSLNVNVSNFPATQPVSGTVIVVQPTGTNLHIVVDSGTIAATQSGAWTTDRTWALSSGTDSVAAVQSGTWTVQQGTPPWSVAQSGIWNINNISGTISLPTGAATATNQTNGNQRSQLVNSSNVVVDAFALSATPTGSEIGLVTNSVIYGHTTAGGGGYVEVKVNPSGTMTVDASGSSVIVSGSVTANQGTSPWAVSGTVTANAGTNLNTSALALDATLTNATQKTKIVDTAGTNVAIIDAAGDLQVDVNNFPATVAVTQSTSPWVVSGTVVANAGTGNFTVVQSTGTNLHVAVDNFPATQPISGTITANQGTSPWIISGTVTANAGTGTFLIDGSAHTQPVSGTVAVTQSTSPWLVSGTVTANAGTGNFTVVQSSGTNLHAVVDSGTIAATQSGEWDVNIEDTAGNALTSTGGALDINIKSGSIANTGFNVNNFPATQAVTQSGTWTVQPGNTANTTPWLAEQRATTIASYSAAVTGLATAVTATDIIAIGGSATKTIKIVRVAISATQTTAGDNTILLIKRSTADTGGTSVTQTAVAHDSANAAATATFKSYTANPVLGNTIATIAVDKIFIATTASNVAASRMLYEWGALPEQPIVLRGTAEQLCVNLNSVTIAGSAFNIWAEWTEE